MPPGNAALVRAVMMSEVDAEPSAGRIPIVIERTLGPMLDRAVGALVAWPDLGLYSRGGALVRIVQKVEEGHWGVEPPSPSAAIAPVRAEYLRELLDVVAHWQNRNAKGQLRDALPPSWVVAGLLDRGEWPLPVLEGVVSTPVFRSDGVIRSELGYDPTTGLYFDPGSTDFPPVPDWPTQDDGRAAWLALRGPFQEFPFVSESDASALVAAFLSLVARQGIAGPCPLTAVRAPVPGSGKSLLADAIAILATGHTAPRMTAPRDDDEMRKRILSLAIEGAPLVLIDNVEGVFGSASIAAQITGDVVADRLLGSSHMLSLPFRPVWLVTGNNVQFKGDLGRRVVLCDLDPRCEHPEDRTDFKIPDLPVYLRRHRPELVQAGLTLLRAFHVAGRPGHGKPPKGSFEKWDDLIRAGLIWAGAADPLGGQERLREAGDAELEALRAALGAWEERHGATPMTLAKALPSAADSDDPLRAALAELCGCDPAQVTSTKAGHALKRVTGRVVSGLRFVKDGVVHGTSRWKVVRQEP